MLRPVAAGDILLLARLALTMFLAIPAEVLAYAFWRLHGAALRAPGAGLTALFEANVVATAIAFAVLAIPLTMVILRMVRTPPRAEENSGTS